jgi:phage anti-repressor protein
METPSSPIASANLDIVNLIEKNPMTRLSRDYQNKFVQKIQQKFTETQQHLFIGSFYCYLNYGKNDFVIDLENVWKWLDFARKDFCKRVLEKHFVKDIDYIVALLQVEKRKNEGGFNKETILMNVNTFKKLCLKSNTKKADEIHDYFIKLEETFQEIVNEESNELRQQLQTKENIIMTIKETSTKEKQKAVEKAIVVQFPVNTECIYLGTIDNTNDANEKLIKFGHTNDLSLRLKDHHKTYNNFALINAFRVQNKVEIENLIKTHPQIKPNIRSIEINGKNKTEIITYNDNFTIEKLSKYIKDIIESKIYSIDNFNKLVKKNEELENENQQMNEQIKEKNCLILKQTLEINELKEKTESQRKIIENYNSENQSVYHNVLLPEDETTKRFNDFINQCCIIRVDLEEKSVNMEGRYRIWSQTKATKETFQALKLYLDTRFRPKRVQGKYHGYGGITLKTMEYKKTNPNSNVELFLFQECKFSDEGNILNSVLLREYQKWKVSTNRETSENDMKELKDYLNTSPYTLKATVWSKAEQLSNEGYYGISLKDAQTSKPAPTNGKKVEKKLVATGDVLKKWDTILNAALEENISPATMSRYVKHRIVIGDCFYCLQE